MPIKPKVTKTKVVKTTDGKMGLEPKLVDVFSDKPKTSEYKMSDPSAIPTGSPDADGRIENAIKENRWVTVGRDYSEEWQRIILIAINGIGGLVKLIGKMNNESRGITMLNGEEKKTDDLSMFFGGVETQGIRLGAVADHMKKFEFRNKDKSISPDFASKLRGISDRIYILMANPDKDAVRTGLTEIRNALIDLLASEGFTFKLEMMPYVGEKMSFDIELHFIGV